MARDLSKLSETELLEVFQKLISKPTPLTPEEEEDLEAIFQEMEKRDG